MTTYIDDDGFVQGAERSPVCLMSFEQITNYIRTGAAEIRKSSGADESGLTALGIARQILLFAIKEGFVTDFQLVDKALHDDEDRQFYFDEEGLNFLPWHYLELLLEQLGTEAAQKKLSERTAFLLELWDNEPWGSEEF